MDTLDPSRAEWSNVALYLLGWRCWLFCICALDEDLTGVAAFPPGCLEAELAFEELLAPLLFLELCCMLIWPLSVLSLFFI